MPEFRIEPMPSRKADNDTVVYYVKDPGSNTLVAKFDTSIQKAENIEGWESFSPTQKLELQNFVANVRFVIDTLGLPAKLNRAYRISLPEPLQTALVDLAESAKANQIEFDPMTAMLNGLLNHIRTTEKRINQFKESHILENIGINLIDENKLEQIKETRKYTKKIFKALLGIPNNLEKYADLSKKIYEKETNLNSSAIVKYAEGKAKPSQWSVSCALAVLAQARNELINKLPLEVLISLWLEPLKFAGKTTSSEAAYQRFEKTFLLDAKTYQAAKNIIHQKF